MPWFVIDVLDVTRRPVRRVYYATSRVDAEYLVELLKKGYICMDHVESTMKCRRLGMESKWRYITVKEVPKPSIITSSVDEDLIRLRKQGVIH